MTDMTHLTRAGLLLALLVFSRQQQVPFADLADRLSFACTWGAACSSTGCCGASP